MTRRNFLKLTVAAAAITFVGANATFLIEKQPKRWNRRIRKATLRGDSGLAEDLKADQILRYNRWLKSI